MKRYIYIFILLSFGCTNVQQKESASVDEEKTGIKTEENETQILDSLEFITPCDTTPLAFMKTLEERKSLLSFQRQTYIYCSPTFDSQIIDSIPFNTKIVSHKFFYLTLKSEHTEKNEDRPASKRAKKWYETKINGQTGFLPEARWAEKILGTDVLFGIGSNLDSFQIISFDSENKQKTIDSLKLYINHGHSIESLRFNGLDLCTDVIRYYDYRTNCPGTSSTTFIAVRKQGDLIKLLSSYHGTESNTTIYFPMKFKNGKTLMVADGNLDQIFNYSTGELNTFAYPEEIDVPINQLVITVRMDYAEDIEGLSSEEIEITKVDTTYYQWDGNELIKIKTTTKGS